MIRLRGRLRCLTDDQRTADGERLQRLLRPGQRLVSVEGQLWRWDGASWTEVAVASSTGVATTGPAPGAAGSSSRRCMACGNVVHLQGARYCHRCGAALAG